MKKTLGIFCLIALIAVSCDDDDIRVFEKSADERVAEAIGNLKADLVAPPNGWRVKYRPVNGAGAFYILMKFDANNKVNVRSDIAADERAYTNQTVSYRIDNSLGLELILENYTAFHYLFEQDQATFGAEYEFNFANKTPDGSLVFTSKTDIGPPSTLLFEPAAANDVNLLGVAISENLETLTNDLELFSSSIKIDFLSKDVILYGGIDVNKRILSISAATSKTNPQNIQFLDLQTSYIIQGSSIVFDSPVTGNFSGTPLSISSIAFTTLSQSSVTVCTTPTTIHAYAGKTSSGDDISFATTIENAGGAAFAQGTIYGASLENIRNNGEFVVEQIQADLKGAVQMALLYGLSYQGEVIYGIGFVLVNDDGSVTYALKEFTPTLIGNNLTFAFKPGYKLLLDQNPDADLTQMDKYILPLAEGNKTYVYKYAEGFYEFNNPCSGWTIAFNE